MTLFRRLGAALAIGTLSMTLAAAEPAPWQSEHHRDHPLVGKLWSVAEGRFVDEADMIGAMAKARYVALGEVHPNADHHAFQARIITALAAAGRKPAVVVEMIPDDYAQKLGIYLATHNDAEALGDELDWQKRGWPQWSIYRPFAEAAMAAHLDIRPGNIASDKVRDIGSSGLAVFADDRRRELGLDAELSATLADDLLEELFQSHCELVPRQAMAPMAAVQRARDAVMADAMIAADGDGAVLIAGTGHVRADRGVPWYLRARGAAGGIVTLAMREVDPEDTDPADYVETLPGEAPQFDYVWFTPKAEIRDHCAELKAHFAAKKKPVDE